MREYVGRSSRSVDRTIEEKTRSGPTNSRAGYAFVINDVFAGRRSPMSNRGLFLVKELSANVEKCDEDLSEYSIFGAHALNLLQHYLRLSLDYGRIPSVLGGLVTRARVSHTKMHSMEDDTIFIHDISRCLEQELKEEELRLMALIVFMDHTFDEAAAMQGYSLRQTYRMFYDLMDRLTRAFFDREFLDREKLMGVVKKPMGRARPGTIEASAAQ
jgi:hypothetical protein